MNNETEQELYVFLERSDCENLSVGQIQFQLILKAAEKNCVPIDCNPKGYPNIYLRAAYELALDVKNVSITEKIVMFIKNKTEA